MTTRPVWAEIDLSAIENNVRIISKVVGPKVGICAVVKADGYGHGAIQVAKAALAAGATSLAVALVEEGRELRAAGVKAPIIVFGAAQAEDATIAVLDELEVTVFDESTIKAFDIAGRDRNKKARLHLKIDTGMSRIGCAPSAAPALATLISTLHYSTLSSCYSHFASADDPNLDFAHEQLRLFLAAVAAIEAGGIVVPIRHMANSAGTLWLPESRLDMVRIGIAMYGLRPDHRRDFPVAGIRPALSVKARVIRVEKVESGRGVSYGRTWTATRSSRIATVPLGYADGYPRRASGRIWAGFKGFRLPQVGRICMDMAMFDASECPELVEGSLVTIMGSGGPSIEEVGDAAETINYEIACAQKLRLVHHSVQGG